MIQKELLTPKARNARILEKRDIVLKFLRDETYTSAKIISSLLHFKSVQAAHQTLNKMVREGFLRKATVCFLGRSIVLYGINDHGLAYSWGLNQDPQSRPTFQPSKVSLSQLPHKLELQEIRLKAQSLGWSKWIPGERLGLSMKGLKRPDALVEDSEGNIIAIEVERTIKSPKRYAEILLNHLIARKNSHYSKVLYLSPDIACMARVKRCFERVTVVKYQGNTIAITPQHLSFFDFKTYGEFQS